MLFILFRSDLYLFIEIRCVLAFQQNLYVEEAEGEEVSKKGEFMSSSFIDMSVRQ